MGFKDALKKVGTYINPPKSQEEIDFEKKFKEQKQKAYNDEALKQAKVMGRLQAKQKYGGGSKTGFNDPIGTSAFNNLMYGTGPSESPKKKLLKKKIKEKTQRNVMDDIMKW